MPWRAPSDIDPVEHDRPGVGLEIAGDHVDESCLARAVGADQADLLAGRDIDGESVGGDHRAKALIQPAHGEDWLHNTTPFSAGRGVVEIFFLCRSLIQSEPMPRGRNRMTPKRKTPSTSCQVLGR